jgi:hypothetical protein
VRRKALVQLALVGPLWPGLCFGSDRLLTTPGRIGWDRDVLKLPRLSPGRALVRPGFFFAGDRRNPARFHTRVTNKPSPECLCQAGFLPALAPSLFLDDLTPVFATGFFVDDGWVSRRSAIFPFLCPAIATRAVEGESP